MKTPLFLIRQCALRSDRSSVRIRSRFPYVMLYLPFLCKWGDLRRPGWQCGLGADMEIMFMLRPQRAGLTEVTAVSTRK